MNAVPSPRALLASVAALSSTVSATGILLPLYVYPSAQYNDSAANWQPALDAMRASRSVTWLTVVNPDSGPGNLTLPPANGDINYQSGISQLNAQPNVKTIGYVRTNYSVSPLSVLEANITKYASWTGDLAVDGIFFDETNTSSVDYLTQAVSFARSAFGSSRPITTICNFGVVTPSAFYASGLCDVNIVYEGYLNNGNDYYDGDATLNANIPSGAGNAAKSAVVVHDFTGTNHEGVAATTALLRSYVSEAENYGLGWLFFCSAEYTSITTPPATIGALAASF
ncbi:Spherulation-specific family 4-domain-containing protein [Xylariaceae sp. FL0594]|nr:Spherulation-specific family 4-domain-containing protein [Xylariaceae sp. FL0594]